MAVSFETRICFFWQVWETTKAAKRITPTKAGRIQRRPAGTARGAGCGGTASDGGTELVPDVREQDDHEHHDGTDNRDRDHRVLEAPGMVMQPAERELTSDT